MSAWVSREWKDAAGKRKREKTQAGVKGIIYADRFLVQWLDPDNRLRQERIKIEGKPGKRLADRRAEQITAELTLGTYERREQLTWTEFRNELDDKFLFDKAIGTRRLYQDTLNLFQASMKPKMVHSIKTSTVDDFRTMLSKRPGKKSDKASPATVNRHLRHLRAVLRWAKKREYLPKMPEVQMVREPEKFPVFMLPEHFDLIYQACEHATTPIDRPYSPADWWRSLMVCGVMTGLRVFEMLTLPWEDVSLDRKELIVRHHEAKGRRDELVPIHPIAVEHLRLVQDYGQHVFAWPHCETHLYAEWHRIQEEAGIQLTCHEKHNHTDSCRVYGFHSLKKACGTMNASRLPQTVLNAFMRHRSFATTEKHYINKQKSLEGHADSMWVPDVLQPKSGE